MFNDCQILEKMLHSNDVVLDTGERKYAAKIIFKPRVHFTYCEIEIYLEVEEGFFLQNARPFVRPKSKVYCENCESAIHQMKVIIAGQANQDWAALTFNKLTQQLL
jgi:hypothetical protein